MYQDDISCILGIANKDERALKNLIDKYVALVSFIVKNIIGSNINNSDIEECISDVFIFIWENIEKYNSGKGTVKTWIVMCSRYKALDYKRNLKKDSKLLNIEDINEKDIPREEGSLETYVINKDIKNQILNEVNKFSKIDKEVFYYRYFLHLSTEDISKIYKTTRAAIDNRLYRCRKILKEKIEY